MYTTVQNSKERGNIVNRTIKVITTAIITSLFLATPVFAADISSINYARLGVVGDTEELAVASALSKVSPNVLQVIKANGYSLFLTDIDIQSAYTQGMYKGNWMGLTDYANKIIYVDATYYTNDPKYNLGNIEYVTIHELGHAFQRLNNLFCASPLWLECYNREYSNIAWMLNSNCTNTDEYFAECFHFYCTCPSGLKQYAPSSYTVIDTMVHPELYIQQ